MKTILGKFRILKTVEEDSSTAVYLVEDQTTKEKYVLKKLSATTSNPLYQTAVKEFEEMENNTAKIVKTPDSPGVVDFFISEGDSYFLLDYKDDESLKIVSSYPSIGKLLSDRYVVVKGVASGGFGKVYIIRDLSLPGKYWALKEMQEEGGIPEIMEKSFRIEAEMLSSLEHQSIPRISDFLLILRNYIL